MCLYPIHKRVKTAKKPIECWKIVSKPNKQGFMKPGYYTYIYTFKQKRYFAYDGFGNKVTTLRSFGGQQVNEGLHAWKKKPHWSIPRNNRLLKFEIPIGAKYFEGGTDIVSTELMLISKR